MLIPAIEQIELEENMKPFRCTIVLAALMMLSVNLHSFQAGERFPDLSLPSLKSGEPLSIGQLQGQKLMLHIFASW